MQFGLTYLFRNAPDSGVSDSHLYGAKLDQIRLAESLGFDDIWVGEHHFVEDGWLPSPLTVAAAIAATTTRVTIGTYATLAALYHPIRLAEDCAVVDNISGGRFLLGAALGYRAKEFEVLGVPYRQRGSRLEETLGILRRCWTEEVFSHSGRHYTFEDVRCYPKPTQRPIPIWVGAAVADSSVERAARLGDGWLNGDPSWSSRPRYIEALAAAGKDPTRPRIVGASKQWILATRDPERDWAMVRPHAVEQVRLIERWFAESGQAGMLGDDVDAVMRTLFLVDTPENVVREIQAAHEIGGFERHIHSPNIPGVPIDRANEALELFAAEVLPAVRSPGESPAAVS